MRASAWRGLPRCKASVCSAHSYSARYTADRRWHWSAQPGHRTPLRFSDVPDIPEASGCWKHLARSRLVVWDLFSAGGAAYLALAVNSLSSLIAALTLVSYLASTLPLKRKTPMCTFIGALPGAAPPLIGWAAASGNLSFQAWLLYSMLFLWQFPHFMAIAWMYREDYDRAGYQVLPRRKNRQTFFTFQSVMPGVAPDPD